MLFIIEELELERKKKEITFLVGKTVNFMWNPAQDITT